MKNPFRENCDFWRKTGRKRVLWAAEVGGSFNCLLECGFFTELSKLAHVDGSFHKNRFSSFIVLVVSSDLLIFFFSEIVDLPSSIVIFLTARNVRLRIFARSYERNRTAPCRETKEFRRGFLGIGTEMAEYDRDVTRLK